MNYICSDGVNSTTVPVGLYEMNVTSRTGRFVVRRERPIPLPSRSRPRDPPSGPSVSDSLSSPCQRCPPAVSASCEIWDMGRAGMLQVSA